MANHKPPPTLEQRIVAALADNTPQARTLANLIQETELAIVEAEAQATTQQQRALDPILSPDPIKAREAAEFAAVRRQAVCAMCCPVSSQHTNKSQPKTAPSAGTPQPTPSKLAAISVSPSLPNNTPPSSPSLSIYSAQIQHLNREIAQHQQLSPQFRITSHRRHRRHPHPRQHQAARPRQQTNLATSPPPINIEHYRAPSRRWV